MIERRILGEKLEEIISNFDWFNNYQDTQNWLDRLFWNGITPESSLINHVIKRLIVSHPDFPSNLKESGMVSLQYCGPVKLLQGEEAIVQDCEFSKDCVIAQFNRMSLPKKWSHKWSQIPSKHFTWNPK